MTKSKTTTATVTTVANKKSAKTTVVAGIIGLPAKNDPRWKGDKKSTVTLAKPGTKKVTNRSLVLKYVKDGITDPTKITNLIVGRHKKTTSVPSVRWYFYNDEEINVAFKKASK